MYFSRFKYTRIFIVSLSLVGMLAACASTKQAQSSVAELAFEEEVADPWEKFNRKVFAFNDHFDTWILQPVALRYQRWVPSPVKRGITNFFGNLDDLWGSVNRYFQGHPQQGTEGLMRFFVNSGFGLGGLIDIGSDIGLKKNKTNFGETLGIWGVDTGPYLVLPFLGPSTLRDTLAMSADSYGNPWFYLEPEKWRYVGNGVNIVNQRARLLTATNLLETAALDRYLFVRDAYMQYKQAAIAPFLPTAKELP